MGSAFFTPSSLHPCSATFQRYMALKRQIHGVKPQPPQRAASQPHPLTPRVFPSFTLLDGWSLSVSGQAAFGGVRLERHHQTPKLCVGCQQSQVPWKGGGTLGTELIYEDLLLLKGLPAVSGLRGACEFLNSFLPPSRSCTARYWDKRHLGFPHLLQEAGEPAAVAPQGSDDSDHLPARVIRNPYGERPYRRAQLAVKAAVLFYCKVNSLSQMVFYLIFAGRLCAEYG